MIFKQFKITTMSLVLKNCIYYFFKDIFNMCLVQLEYVVSEYTYIENSELLD